MSAAQSLLGGLEICQCLWTFLSKSESYFFFMIVGLAV